MKQKILFYGNCHTWALAKYFLLDPELQERFEVIVTNDGSCLPMSQGGIYFRVWTKQNRPLQQEFYTAVHEKIKQADFFIFQDMSVSSSILQLTTKFLCDNIVTGRAICVPNPRLTIHCFKWNQKNPYLKYARTKVSDPYNTEEIVEFLRTSDDPKLTEILEQEYPISTGYKAKTNENQQRAKLCMEQYPTYICMENFLKENFKSIVVAFDCLHPTKAYFVELLRLVLANIGLTDFNVKEEYCKVQGPQRATINPMQFKFFREYFPLLNDKFQSHSKNNPIKRHRRSKPVRLDNQRINK